MILQRHGSIYQRYAGVHYDIGKLEQVLTAGMTACFVASFSGWAVNDYFHTALLSFQCHVDVYCIDPCVRENPDAIFGIEIIILHDCLSVTLCSFQKQELMDTHLADDLCKECQRKFAQWVKTYKTTDTRIHFFNGNCCVTTSERVYPTAGFDGICHSSGCLFDILQLRGFQFFHDAMRVF